MWSAHEGQQRALDCLELELHTVVNDCVGAGSKTKIVQKEALLLPGQSPGFVSSLCFLSFIFNSLIKVEWGLIATVPVWHLQRLEDNLWELAF